MARLGDRLRTIWRKITLRRHKGELAALRLSRRLGPLAGFPIFLSIFFWWFTLNLPAAVLGLVALSLMESSAQGKALIGGALYLPLSIYALIVLCAAAPWFFRWYFIAVGLMFGRTAMADRKEAELIAAIASTSCTSSTHHH